jgi:hypothetical protein
MSKLNKLIQFLLYNMFRPFRLSLRKLIGRAIAQAVSRWLPTDVVRGSHPGLVMWDFVVDKVALGQVFSEYFGFPCQFSFHQLLQKLSSSITGVCTIGQSGGSTRDLDT